jgi:hypothetical protein
MVRIRVLTALKIKQALKPGMYADGLGLYLQVRGHSSLPGHNEKLDERIFGAPLSHSVQQRSGGA